MALQDYMDSMNLSVDFEFYALIMAAMRCADTDNLTRLQNAFPETWKELQQRYSAPYGCLNSSELKLYAALKRSENDSEE